MMSGCFGGIVVPEMEQILRYLTPIVTLAAVWLISCQSPTPSSEPSSETNVEPGSSLRLYAFDCGRIQYDSLEAMGIRDDETDVRELLVPCYVIEHEKGRLLWDGGLPSKLAETEGWQEMDGGWRMRLDRTFAEQIDDLGWSMADFDFAAFSHFHFDHVGVANELEGAKLLIQRPEYDDAFAEEVTTPGFDPSLYDRFGPSNTQILDGEHDVFGDGTVRLIPTPGHTDGHQVLYVGLSNTGPVLLSGDLHVFRLDREEKWVPPFNADAEQTLESMEKIEVLLQETGATLWIGHELAGFEARKKPPEFHD